MFLKYLSIGCLFHAQLCWSFLVPPFAAKVRLQIPSHSADIGQPLILTPHLKLKRVAYARELSHVKPFSKNVVSNAGFFTVDEAHDSNLFFWFFRKEGRDWDDAPLLVWLQGGPGASSTYGLFEENGPYVVIRDKPQPRKYSWTKHYNVLYFDQPVGTGFSFTNSSQGYVQNQQQVADHLYEALVQFFQLYPELEDNEFFITGESYAGRYVPAFAFKIHTLKAAGKSNINLKGLFLVSGTIDGVGLTTNLAAFCYHVGIIDSITKNQLQGMERDTEAYIRSRLWKNATQWLHKILDKIRNQSSVSFYDYTKSPSGKNRFLKFLQSSDTRKKLHVGNVTFDYFSDRVYENLEDDISKTVVPWVEELLEHYRVAFVGGQFDVIVAYPLVVDVLKRLSWSGAFEYSSAKRKMIFDGKRVGGYLKRAGNLIEVLVRSAGHMVLLNQPVVALKILKQFVNNEL